MYFSPGERTLGDIVKKVESGQRLSKEDGIRLMESNDLLAIGYMSNLVREKINGDNTFFAASDVDKDDKSVNATMLYGHEEIPEFIGQLIQLRDQQDKSSNFKSFTPLAFQSQGTSLEATTQTYITGVEDLKVLAVARLILDNFPHIKASWVTLGPKLLQVSLAFGVDDIDCNKTEQAQYLKEIVNIIKKAARKPMQRDNIYNIVQEDF